MAMFEGIQRTLVLVEEIGKLARASNKLVIARDGDVIKSWNIEVNDRIRTSISLLESIYLAHRTGMATTVNNGHGVAGHVSDGSNSDLGDPEAHGAPPQGKDC